MKRKLNTKNTNKSKKNKKKVQKLQNFSPLNPITSAIDTKGISKFDLPRDNSIPMSPIDNKEGKFNLPIDNPDLNFFGSERVGNYASSLSASGIIEKKELDEKTVETIRNLIKETMVSKKEKTKKEKSLTENDIDKIMERYTKIKHEEEIKKEKEITKTGLELIKEKLNNGYCIQWRCRECGCLLETFIGNEGFENIKNYLEQFKKNEFKPCKNRGKKHLSWFEIKKDKVLYGTLATFDTVLRPIKKQGKSST